MSVCYAELSKHACKAAGIDKHTYYDHRLRFPEFAKVLENLTEELIDKVEWEAFRRALHGVPVSIRYDKDGRAVTMIKRSDRLLIFLLKKRRPEIYGDKVETPRSLCQSPPPTSAHGIEPAKYGVTAAIRAAAMKGLPASQD